MADGCQLVQACTLIFYNALAVIFLLWQPQQRQLPQHQ